MHKKPLLGIIVSFSILCLVLSSLLLRAQHPLPSNPDFVSALWVAKSNAISKVSTTDASALLQIVNVKNVRAVAIDDQRGMLWAYIQNTLRAYRFDGKPAFSVPLSSHSDNGDDKEVTLSVNLENGSVWLGVKKSLYHFGHQGEWLSIHTLSEPVASSSWDPTTSCVWVGTQKTVVALHNTGNLCKVIDLGSHPDVQDLAVDSDSGDLWVAMKKVMQRYDSSGTLMFEVDIKKPAYLTSDHQGGVWIATDKRLMRMDRTGWILFDIEPFHDPDKIVALMSDPTDSSVWVASKKKVRHIGSDGNPLRQLDFMEEIRDLALYADLIRPGIAFIAPQNGVGFNTDTPAIQIQYQDSGSGIDLESLRLQVNDVAWSMTCQYGDRGASCMPTAGLPEGLVTLAATIQDFAGNTSKVAEAHITVDITPPLITPTSPTSGTFSNQPLQSFVGSLSELATLTLNGEDVWVEPTLGFNHGPVSLHEGFNSFELLATDALGNSSHLNIYITLDTTPPAAVDKAAIEVDDIAKEQVRVRGKAGSIEPGASVSITNTRTGQAASIRANSDGTFEITMAAQGGDVLAIVTIDPAGNASAPSSVEVENALPSDPSLVSPPLDRTVATDFATATAFLYSGSRPIQTDIVSGTIEPRRVAVLRGQVQTREGASLAGVTITILGHPEYGQTRTRADGMFDIAANGGGVLTVRYEKVGYVPVQRQVQTPWRDYAWVQDVVMLPYDEQVSTIDLAMSTDMQVALGSVMTDESGTRQATLLFAPGTEATMVLPDGTTQLLTTLHVRATEYTVGPNGPKAMPGTLPPTSAYTYAVELSVDEAVAADATAVQFTPPVIFYVQNFLDFPVGGIVPTGYYDRSRGIWVPSDNGRIIEVLDVGGELAMLDTNGDGTADEESALMALGITESERQRLASQYQQGQSFWRVPIAHFTPWDCNWPFGPPPDAEAPKQPEPRQVRHLDDPTCQGGSIIECENQTLGEVVSLTGTALGLHYRSDRVPGRKNGYMVHIPLTGATVAASLKRIELITEVAGQQHTQSFPAMPYQSTDFVWNGQDVYGRKLQGLHPMTIHIGYVYDAVYGEPAQFAQSFGIFARELITGNFARQEITFWQEQHTHVGVWVTGDRGIDGRGTAGQGLGGWTPSHQHFYDPSNRTLYRGDGSRRTAHNVAMIILTVAGNGESGAIGDGGPAANAQIGFPTGVAIDSHGNLFIADRGNDQIRVVSSEGTITTMAGTGVRGYSGDDGPATSAQLYNPTALTVDSRGNLFITETPGVAEGLGNRVRRVSPKGIITTVAGTGMWGASGDGGPAIGAQLNLGGEGGEITVDGQGNLFIADTWNNRVRKVSPDGIIITVAGNGQDSSTGDGGFATDAALNGPTAVAVDRQGNLFIAEGFGSRVRKVSPDGIIGTMAGIGTWGYGGDGGMATSAGLEYPTALAMDAQGSLFIAEGYGSRVRKVSPDGIITTVAGTGAWGSSGDAGPAAAAQLGNPYAVALDPEYNLYIADGGNSRVNKVTSPLSGFSSQGYLIPAANGEEVYEFDNQGRHLRTLNALTGAQHYEFRYNSEGYVVQIVDGDGKTTIIDRDSAGFATAIVAPFGQRTTLSMNEHGYLATLTNPAGETIRFTYTENGLLTSMTNPNDHTSRFSYDPLGRLSRDEDPAGGFKAMTSLEDLNTLIVGLTSAMGRLSSYEVTRLSSGIVRRVTTDPASLQSVTETGSDGRRRLTAPDGSVITLLEGPEPRFGMQVPLIQSLAVTSPGGLSAIVTETRTVALANPLAPLSLTHLTHTVTINGRSSSRAYDADSRTVTNRTAMGRQMVSSLDGLGRVVAQRVTGLEPLRYTYDSLGHLVAITQGSRRTLLGYDGMGRLATISDPLSRIVSFEYDAVGRITRQVLPDGREVLSSYDANGNVTSITPPGSPSHAFTYTAIDLEERYLPPEIGEGLSLTDSTYNLDRQLVEMTRPDGTAIALGYDGAGRPSALMSPRGKLVFGYHPTTGNLATITDPDGGMLSYDYDGRLLTRETLAGTISGNIQYTYDNNFRLTSQGVNGDSSLTFEYDADSLLTQAGALAISRDSHNGQITGSTLGNIVDARTYNSFGELTSYRATFSGNDIFAVQYMRDQVGRIIQKTEALEGQSNAYSYIYDVAGRLTEKQRNGSTVASYAYDSNGNRLSHTSPNATLTGTYDLQDRLLQYGSTRYTYTASGELRHKTESGQMTSYDYDALGNLRTVGLPDGQQIEYVIDGRNRRVGKKVNGILVKGFLYDGDLAPVAELDGSGHVTARFIYGTRGNVPDYVIKGGITYRIITDHLGSPRVVVATTTGHVVQRMVYDVFGQVIFDDNPGFQPFGFAGGLYDPDTRLTRFGARDYDAQVGRWTAKDPIRFAGGDTNLYGYVLNDPVNWIDPTGLFLDTVFDAGFIAYDLIRLVRDNLLGNCDNIGSNLVALGADAAGAIIPFVTGLGTATRGGKVVIGKLKDLRQPEAVRAGERALEWTDRGTAKLNWEQNASSLREAMRDIQPIRDASVDRVTGALTDNTGFLRAERNLLVNQGWKYNPKDRNWRLPGH